MSEFVTALPMYDWPETRAATDAEWGRFRAFFERAGIAAPERLTRRNADLPPVRGGIRDGEGRLIAPDPSTLPPDEFDFQTLWRHPKLLLAQTCWGPMEQGLAEHVTLVGQPSYNGIEGGQGIYYSSAILMRRDSPPLRGRWPEGPEGVGKGSAQRESDAAAGRHNPTPDLRSDPPLKGEGGAPAPADGQSLIPLDLIRGQRLAYNELESMSGIIALSRDLEAMGESLGIFAERLETGAHQASIVAVAEGKADVCAIDCRSWKMAQRHEPRAAELQVVGWTGRRKGLPMITSVHTPPDVVRKLVEILAPR